MRKESKIITLYSPMPQSGQTTLANLVGMELARKGKFVLILELSRLTGFSIYLNKNLGEFKRDLKSCLVNPVTFKENLIKSPHSNRLFYICQNAYSSITDLISYNPANIDIIVGQSKDLFDYILLDLPSSTDDVATVQILGRNFTHKIDHSIINLTENVMAVKRLNDFDTLLAKSSIDDVKQDTTIVVNKSYGRYSPFFEPYLKNLPKSNIVNLVNVMNVNELPYLCNEGNLLHLGQHDEAKDFYKDISTVASIIEEDLKGIGMQKVKESKTSKKLRGAKLSNAVDKDLKKGKGKVELIQDNSEGLEEVKLDKKSKKVKEPKQKEVKEPKQKKVKEPKQKKVKEPKQKKVKEPKQKKVKEPKLRKTKGKEVSEDVEELDEE